MKTTEEMIAVMQEFANGKPIQRLKKDWKIWLDDKEPTWDWAIFDYRVTPERHLPTTWEEFCDTHPIKEGEAWITLDSEEHTYTCDVYRRSVYRRNAEKDKNIVPNKRYVEAMLALCQLIQLRDCYNDGWQPNWEDADQTKYCIIFDRNNVTRMSRRTNSQILTFQTVELRDEFLKNFKDLIEQAKPLL